MSIFSRVGALAFLFLSSPVLANQSAQPPQYVIISFDGASFIEQWERSRSLARRTGARFTYFLSCAYLLTPETRDRYRGPRMKAGRTNIGSAHTREEVRQRLQQIWQARAEGHEIANHSCGHFDGSDWSAEEWKDEFSQFSAIVRDAWTINGLKGEPEEWRAFAETEIAGFRAPYLATGPGLFEALKDKGFRYDASNVSRGPVDPASQDGTTRFSLPMIPEGPKKRLLIAMDYNFYVRHSDAKEQSDKSAHFTERALSAFMKAFELQYASDRKPVQFGFHFTLMNGGAYWDALEHFAEAVCGKPDVRCVSYKQYMDETAPASAALRPSMGG